MDMKILHAIGNIDEKFIERAAAKTLQEDVFIENIDSIKLTDRKAKRTKITPWIRWALPIAACLVIALTVTLPRLSSNNAPSKNATASDDAMSDYEIGSEAAETAEVPADSAFEADSSADPLAPAASVAPSKSPDVEGGFDLVVPELDEAVTISESELYLLSVKENTLTPSGATFVFSNKSGTDTTYGETYELECLTDAGDWEACDTIIENYGFNDIGYILPAGESREKEYNWQWLYGNLPAGHYRIVTGLVSSSAGTDGEYIFVVLNTEFDITGLNQSGLNQSGPNQSEG